MSLYGAVYSLIRGGSIKLDSATQLMNYNTSHSASSSLLAVTFPLPQPFPLPFPDMSTCHIYQLDPSVPCSNYPSHFHPFLPASCCLCFPASVLLTWNLEHVSTCCLNVGVTTSLSLSPAVPLKTNS